MMRMSDGGRKLAVKGDGSSFEGEPHPESASLLCPLTADNARALRARLPWLTPAPLGVRASFGFGDRLGLATAGHIAALRAVGGVGGMAPIFAQQSVRENSRIGRTPQQVLDDAMWGVFQEGWRDPWGADADHLKEASELTAFVRAGYTFFTIDPSDYVDDDAQTDASEVLREKASHLPWEELDSDLTGYRQRYGKEFHLEGLTLEFDEITLLRALVKYGRALAHTTVLYRELVERLSGKTFDLELSVDETEVPTSCHEHFFLANELQLRGVPVVSLAPRFVGKFQKGVDYLGDRRSFAAELVGHRAIMRHFDSYKLSVHTGSDKFSIYPILAEHLGKRIHVKTAGTSYLEALRVVASKAPSLFRDILGVARAHFEQDRASYYLDAELERVPAPVDLEDAALPELLQEFDARQVLHVTFGSVLVRFGPEIRRCLEEHEDAYRATVQRHFERHLSPFVSRRVA